MTPHLPTDDLDRNYRAWLLSENVLDGALIVLGVFAGITILLIGSSLLSWLITWALVSLVLYLRDAHRRSQVPRVR